MIKVATKWPFWPLEIKWWLQSGYLVLYKVSLYEQCSREYTSFADLVVYVYVTRNCEWRTGQDNSIHPIAITSGFSFMTTGLEI